MFSVILGDFRKIMHLRTLTSGTYTRGALTSVRWFLVSARHEKPYCPAEEEGSCPRPALTLQLGESQPQVEASGS